MSRRRRLLCSLTIAAVTLATLGRAPEASAAPVQPDAPSKLIDVKDVKDLDGGRVALRVEDAPIEPTWTVLWNDLGVNDGDAPVVSVDGGGLAEHQGDGGAHSSSQPPPIIAAPLPPAIVSGLIGLAAVYAYKRRNRFANR